MSVVGNAVFGHARYAGPTYQSDIETRMSDILLSHCQISAPFRPFHFQRPKMNFSTKQYEEIPPPKVSCDVVEPAEVYEWLEQHKAAGEDAQKDFQLVDVRLNEWEGGTITTSINLPAQSFYQAREMVYMLSKQAGVKKVVFYCGSCGTRGPKCAGWFQEYLNSVGETEMKALILKGGFKGWKTTYNGQMVDVCDPDAWRYAWRSPSK